MLTLDSHRTRMLKAISSINPKKSLGQHFLIDDNIARNIIRDLHLSVDDVVVEIGPGRGALTKYLAEKVHKLIAVEIDYRVVEELRARFDSPKVTILHQDFLTLDLHAVREQVGQPLRLVGNIPYHLTSPILIKAFDERKALRDFTLMVQREVAERLAARPGTKRYGILSVYAQFYGELELLFNVSPNCFYPKPKVSSAVVQEKLFEQIPYNVDEQMFRTVVRTAFGKRRKTLRNALKYLPFGTDVTRRIVQVARSMLDKRPEQIAVEQFVELTNAITENYHVTSFPTS